MFNKLINKIEHCKVRSKNQSIIRLHFDIHENSAKHRNDIDSTSKTLKINKREKSKRDKKKSLINQKFENKETNK